MQARCCMWSHHSPSDSSIPQPARPCRNKVRRVALHLLQFLTVRSGSFWAAVDCSKQMMALISSVICVKLCGDWWKLHRFWIATWKLPASIIGHWNLFLGCSAFLELAAYTHTTVIELAKKTTTSFIFSPSFLNMSSSFLHINLNQSLSFFWDSCSMPQFFFSMRFLVWFSSFLTKTSKMQNKQPGVAHDFTLLDSLKIFGKHNKYTHMVIYKSGKIHITKISKSKTSRETPLL